MPGEIRWDLSREEYDALTERVSWSKLKAIKRSPRHFLSVCQEKQPDTDALKVGRAGHWAVYEPEKFASLVAVWGMYEDQKVRRGKVWDAFAAEHFDKEILTEAEHAQCVALAAAVREDTHARKYVDGGKAEPSILWERDGVHMKSRLDFLADCGAIVDLKSCEDASPAGFLKSVLAYGYLGQAAVYTDAVAAVMGEVRPFVFLAVEKKAPFVVQTYRVPPELVELGRREYRSLLEQLTWCRSQNFFPGYADGEIELVMPEWARNKMEAANG